MLCSFSKLPVASPTSQLILQPFRRFTYVTAHSPTLPLVHLRHSSFSNPSVASPTSQHILQPFRCFTYVTAHSPTLVSLLLRHRLFTYITWRAAHDRIESPDFGELTSCVYKKVLNLGVLGEWKCKGEKEMGFLFSK